MGVSVVVVLGVVVGVGVGVSVGVGGCGCVCGCGIGCGIGCGSGCGCSCGGRRLWEWQLEWVCVYYMRISYRLWLWHSRCWTSIHFNLFHFN